MSKTVQFKRGNANVSATYVGAQGEITVNTDNYTLNVHDGIRAGGYSILNSNVSNIGNLVIVNQTITGTIPNTNITLSPNAGNVTVTSNLFTPNIAIRGYTIQSVNSGSLLSLPATSDGANIDVISNSANIRFTTYDSTTNVPYTLVLERSGDVIIPGYIKSNLGRSEIQFAGTQGMLLYADINTGSTGISLNDQNVTDIFANSDIRITTNYSGIGRQWLFRSNGQLATSGNLSTANLSISHLSATNQVYVRTLANSDLKLTATDGTYESSIHLWANNQRMSFNTISNAFDFNFNGQLSATDFTASKNSAYGYSFYAEGSGYSGMRHNSGPPDVISIDHEGNTFVRFVANYTTDIYGNLVVSSDGETFGSFPDAFVQVYSNVDSYTQAVFQNLNEGASASTDVVVTADNGNDSSHYVDLGITSSQHADPEFFGDTTAINDAYLYVTGYDQTGPSLGNVGNLIIGSTNGKIKLFVGNTAEANVVATLSESLITVSGNIIPSANITYALGSETNQWRDLWVSNNTIYIGGVALSVDASGNLTVNGNVVSDGGGGSNYGNSNVASYLTTYTGNIAGNIVKNGYAWTFGTDGDLTLPITANSDTSIGTAFNTNPPGHTLTVKHNGGVTGGSGGELKFDYGNTQIKVVKDAGTTQTWTFGSDGTTQFPNSLILAPVSQSITMQSDQYSQLMWENANVTVAPNMAINSNFYVAQNNATLDIGYRDGNSTQLIKSWYWSVDGSMTLPAAGRINFDYLSISSYNDVSAFYAPSGNVQLAAGTGDAQIVANSLNDSKTWIFGADGNLALPHSGVLLVSGGITAGPLISSPAPYLSGFSSISAVSMSASGNISSGNMSTGVITLTNGAVIKDNAGDSVAFGQSAGATSQGNSAVAIGHNAGVTSQGTFTVAIGRNAGQTSQGGSSVAVGVSAGDVSQGAQAVAVGNGAGGGNQGNSAVAIGVGAGQSTQGVEAVAIGNSAGSLTQGISAIAIGKGAGRNFQGNNSVIINATGADLNQTTANTFTVAPVRNDVANVAEILFYNTTSKEVTYGNTISVAGNISAGNVNITGNIVDTGALSIITGSNGNIALNPNGTGIVTVSNALTVAGNITGNTGGFAIGYRDIPQVVFTSNATLALTDAGKHYFSSNSANVITVPNNTTVSFSIGTAISIIQQGTANLTVTPDSGVTMYLAGNSTSASRTVGNYGMATLMKVGTDTWFINGTGVN